MGYPKLAGRPEAGEELKKDSAGGSRDSPKTSGVRVLGRIKAPDKATAIAEAIKQFNIDDAHRSRLIATPVE